MSPIPPDASIDLEHLQQMTMGDPDLTREVVTLFAAQASELIGKLQALPPDAAHLAHKLKGSARAIGAFNVADAVENFERALRSGGAPSEAFAALKLAVDRACAAIDAMLRQG